VRKKEKGGKSFLNGNMSIVMVNIISIIAPFGEILGSSAIKGNMRNKQLRAR
jgi:hypothetical protein